MRSSLVPLLASAAALALACSACGADTPVGNASSATPPAAPPASAANAQNKSAPPAGAASATSPAIAGVTWYLSGLEGPPVSVPPDRGRPSLAFDPEAKRVSGLAAVNRFSGNYTLEGGALKFGPLMATKMAGPPELNELETRFLKALEKITAWRLAGGQLELLAGEQVVARFARG